jgi:phosphatidylserine/phosphatidylglycerophosphate/cardiolipin synthase-like enzyme
MTRTQRVVIIGTVLFAVLFVAVLLFADNLNSPSNPTATAVARSSPTPTRVAAQATASLVATLQPGATGLFVEPDDGRAPVLNEINGARQSITLEIYLLSDREIIDALKNANDRGIDVRVLLEENPFGGRGNQPGTYNELEGAGINIRWSNPVFTFSHIKTFVIDNNVALIMNLNLSKSSFTRNREFGIVTTDPAAVQTASQIFEADWTRSEEPSPGSLVVSPTNSRAELLGLIHGSTKNLDIYAEVMRDREIIDALLDARQRGVSVRLIMSDDSTDGDKERHELDNAGVQVRIENSPYVHAKMVLADDQRVFIGSENFTATSMDQNRELGIITTEPTVLARVQQVFNDDFGEAAKLS